MSDAIWIEPSLLGNRLDYERHQPQYLEAEMRVRHAKCLRLETFEDARDRKAPINNSLRDMTHALTPAGIPVFRATNIQSPWIDPTDILRIDPSVEATSARSRLRGMDIVISIAGTLGGIGLVPQPLAGGNINSSLARFRAAKPTDAYYFVAFLCTETGQRLLLREAVGSVQRHLNLEDIPRALLPRAPAHLETAIGNKVKQAERLRNLTKQAFAAARAGVEALLDGRTNRNTQMPGANENELLAFQGNKLIAQGFAAFVPADLLSGARLDCDYYGPTFVENAERLQQCGVPLERIGDITEASSDGTHDTIEKLGGYQSSGVRFITSGEVTAGFSTKPLFISEKAHEQNKRSEVLPGDLLLAVRGSSSVGLARVYPEAWGRANINTAVARLRFKRDVDAAWVALFLNSRAGRLSTLRIANGVNQLNLNMEETAELRIPLPSPAVQSALGEALRKAEDLEHLSKAAFSDAVAWVDAIIDGTLDELLLLEENERVEAWLKQNPDTDAKGSS